VVWNNTDGELVGRNRVIYGAPMSTVEEIESAIRSLSLSELAVLRNWFQGFDAAVWDQQFEQDVVQGKLDSLADEALNELRAGRSSKL
jgi:hypothetical protein